MIEGEGLGLGKKLGYVSDDRRYEAILRVRVRVRVKKLQAKPRAMTSQQGHEDPADSIYGRYG